jgi:transcriptional regulator with XRE-family HTH domain
MKRSRIAALAKVLKISPAVIMGYESGILNYLSVDLLEHFKEQGTPELEIVKAYLEVLQNKNSELEKNKEQISFSQELTFGNKIKEARKAKNLTQQQLAKKIGATHNSVSDWENDKNKPDLNTIELICGVLNISANYLLGTKDPAISLSPEATEVAKAYTAAELDKQNIVRLTLGLELKKQSKITEFPVKEETQEHLQTIAAHLDGELTDEIKDFIDKF